MRTRDLLELFTALEAPSIDQMDGDYSSELLAQPTALATALGRMAVDRPLWRWRSKGFRPVDERSGRGYNSFHAGSRMVRRYPMLTRLLPSRFDGRPAYHLIYPAYRSTCGAINMVDELRVAGEGVFLGVGTWGFTAAQRNVPLPFLLLDVGRPYLGDLGRQRSGFVVSPRVAPAVGIGTPATVGVRA